MKKIDDSKLYFYIGMFSLIIGIVVGIISFYSILIVEPQITGFLTEENNIHENYSRAYLILRDPQIFARYENFDSEGISVKNSIIYFDNKIFSGKEIKPGEKEYLEVLLDRRVKGSRLGRYTMVFMFILSFISWVLYFFEKKQIANM